VPEPVPVPTPSHAGLAAAVERVHDLVRIATNRGAARATLQLHPVELGAVNVDLRTTRAGLVATIAASDQAGLDALQHAGAELRRSLEDRGVTLHRIDLQLSDGGQDGRWAREAQNGGSRSGARRGGGVDPLGLAEEDEDPTTLVAEHAWSARSLVDIKA
jgi:flagellar hook-length control protein FliK